MKTNEAPEKIYVDVSLNSVWGMSERSYDNEVEYIRTDAFIEKVCDKLKQLMYDKHFLEGSMHQNAIIENFIRYFKDYIKEE